LAHSASVAISVSDIVRPVFQQDLKQEFRLLQILHGLDDIMSAPAIGNNQFMDCRSFRSGDLHENSAPSGQSGRDRFGHQIIQKI
jgi:hypothetical protein